MGLSILSFILYLLIREILQELDLLLLPLPYALHLVPKRIGLNYHAVQCVAVTYKSADHARFGLHVTGDST